MSQANEHSLYGGYTSHTCGEEVCEHPRFFMKDGGLIAPEIIDLAVQIDGQIENDINIRIKAATNGAFERCARFIEGKAGEVANRYLAELLGIYAASMREFKFQHVEFPDRGDLKIEKGERGI